MRDLIHRPLDPDVLDAPVTGRHLLPGPFGAQLGHPTLLVFLRHFG